jgi:hypothetical protein
MNTWRLPRTVSRDIHQQQFKAGHTLRVTGLELGVSEQLPSCLASACLWKIDGRTIVRYTWQMPVYGLVVKA